VEGNHDTEITKTPERTKTAEGEIIMARKSKEVTRTHVGMNWDDSITLMFSRKNRRTGGTAHPGRSGKSFARTYHRVSENVTHSRHASHRR